MYRKFKSASFQYMLLLRGATSGIFLIRWGTCFNTCSSCEEQPQTTLTMRQDPMFQYMLLLRGATFRISRSSTGLRSFNTCSSCEEQPHGYRRQFPSDVSIHAPLARSNWTFRRRPIRRRFQYMLLLRGATRTPQKPEARPRSFNTCSSCEEQHVAPLVVATTICFNTCSSCEEQRVFL